MRSAIRHPAWLLALVVLAPTAGRAQDTPVTNQIWIDVLLDWHVKPKHVLEVEIGPKLLFSDSETWRELTITPAYEGSPTPWLDLVGRVLFSWVQQTDRLSTFEIRPIAGFRIYFTQSARSRLLIRDFNRVENRNIYYQETGTWSNTWRYRNRLEFQYPLSPNHMSDDDIWYLMADAELFVNLGETPAERFNDNWRLRAGVGYRVGFSWQFEFLYTRQLSRNTLLVPFDVSNNIFRARLKYHWR